MSDTDEPASLTEPRARREASTPLGVVARGQRAVGRLSAFRITYFAIFGFIALYVFSVPLSERLLQAHFQRMVDEAVRVAYVTEPVALVIGRNLETVRSSPWVKIGGVRADVLVIGFDGQSLIYAGGRPAPASPGMDQFAIHREAARLLPATTQVRVSVPHNTILSNAILLVYAFALLQGLFLYNRAIARREHEVLEAALTSRDEAARRAAQITEELAEVQSRLAEVEPDAEQVREVDALQRERESLQAQLDVLAAREEELLGKADRAVELDRERRALEDLLEEAAEDLGSKDGEIRDLEQRLKRANKAKPSGSAKAKESELLAKRFATLYKRLEIDDRVCDDFAKLGDEATRLKAEESLKRLDDDSDNVAVRRKVGGLPSHLSVFELGFAGKGRIYYMKGRQRRFRVLLLGGKASQKPDLDYLRRLEKDA